MAEKQTQTREHHARWHAPFHFFFAPAVFLLIVIAIYEVFRSPGLVSAAQLLLILVVAVVGVLARTYALKVQDRVIRMEEHLRLSVILPSDLLSTVRHLSEQQLIALRFASDDELPELAQRAQAEQLSPKTIKSMIKNWRPDYWRV